MSDTFRPRWCALLAFVPAFLLVSCGTTTSGNPTTTPPVSVASTVPDASPAAATISPCDDLSVSDITALGWDPATKRSSDVRAPGVTERGCEWTGKDALVDIQSANSTVGMYLARKDFIVRPLSISGRVSATIRDGDDPRGCRAMSDIAGGSLIVQMNVKGEHEAAVGDACAAAVKVMEQVAPLLLKAK